MKRNSWAVVISVVLVAMLGLFCVSASAEQQSEVKMFTWEEVMETAESMDPDAGFLQIGDFDIGIWSPHVFFVEEPHESDADNNIFGRLGTENESAEIIFLTRDGQGGSLNDWLAAFTEAGHQAQLVNVNGMDGLMYVDEEQNSCNLLLPLTNGEMLQIVFAPYSDENFKQVIYIMISSIR